MQGPRMTLVTDLEWDLTMARGLITELGLVLVMGLAMGISVNMGVAMATALDPEMMMAQAEALARAMERGLILATGMVIDKQKGEVKW